MAESEGLGLLVWSPLAGGLLSGKFGRGGADDAQSRCANFEFPPVDAERTYAVINVLKDLAAEKGASVAQLAVAWLLHQPRVTSVLFGDEQAGAVGRQLGRSRRAAV